MLVLSLLICFGLMFKGALSGLRQFLASESYFKMMKNAFYFTLKVLLALKIYKVYLHSFVMQKNGLIRKLRLISKLRVTTWLANNCNNILTNILRSKSNHVMKFGQFIEDDMRNIFLEKSYTKCGGETIPRPFSEKSKLSVSLNR